MSPVRLEAWTLPETGTFTRRFHIKDELEVGYSERVNDPGQGTFTIADTNPRARTILSIDPDDRTNDQASLIRAFSGSTPLYDWYVSSITPDDEAHQIKCDGEGIGSCLDRLIVLNRDHDIEPTADPDWSYGQATVLNNPGFEDGSAVDEVQVLYTDATGGTFRLSFDGGSNYTANIAYNASTATITTEIESLAAITDVLVSGQGTEAEPWFLEFTDPQNPAQATVDDALLTGGTVGATISTLTGGGTLDPGFWVQSQNIDGNIYGEYAIFEVSADQAHSGTYSLKIDGTDPTGQFSLVGAQQAVNVVPGRTYYGSAWVYPVGASLEARYVIRESATNNYVTSSTFPFTTCPANTWTELVVDPFVMPDGVTQIYARIASVNKVNPPIFHVDDVTFAEGEPAAPLGQIFNDLLDDIETHFTGATSWLNRTFTDALDSNGAAWNTSLSWRIKRGQTLRQLLDYARRWGYEWRIKWDAVGEVFDFDLYNPTGLGTDRTSTGPAITHKIGAVKVAGDVSRANEANVVIAEGSEGAWGSSSDTPLQSVWGKRFDYLGNKTAADSTQLSTLAAQLISDNKTRAEGFKVTISQPTVLFGSDVDVGDTVTVVLPPRDKRDRRVHGYSYAGTAEGVETVTLEIDTRTYGWISASRNPTSAFTRNSAAIGRVDPVAITRTLEPMADAVSLLLRKFDALDDLGESEGAPWPSTGGQVWPTIIAATDSPDQWKAAAHFLCEDGNGYDHLTIQNAIDHVNSTMGSGTLLFAPGYYSCTTPSSGAAITIPAGINLQGPQITQVSDSKATIAVDFVDGTTRTLFDITGSFAAIRSLTIRADFYSNITAINSDSGAQFLVVERNWIEGDDCDLIRIDNGLRTSIVDNWIDCLNTTAGRHAIHLSGSMSDTRIEFNRGNWWTIALITGSSSNVWRLRVRENDMESPGWDGILIDATDAPAADLIDMEIVGNYINDAGSEDGEGHAIHIIGNPNIDLTGPSQRSNPAGIIGQNFIHRPQGAGIYLENVDAMTVHDNLISETGTGTPSNHALVLENSTHNRIHDNYLLRTEDHNVADGIHLLSGSDQNDIRDNRINGLNITGTDRKFRYCIHIAAADCFDNIVIGNDGRDGYATGFWLDNGTDTVNTWPSGSVGANFDTTAAIRLKGGPGAAVFVKAPTFPTGTMTGGA